ncbi:MAG: DNA primase [Aggregatilineales bacterium]
MSVTQEIKERLDIVNYVQQYVPSLKKAGRNFKANCPFHNENTPSFVVNPDSQSWRCYGACAEGGDLFSFAMKLHGWSFPEALQELGAQAGVEVRKQSPQQQQKNEAHDKLRGMLNEAADFYHRHLVSNDEDAKRVLRYVVKKRGLTKETIETYRIGFAPDGWQTMLEKMKQLGYSEDEIVAAGLAIRNDNGRVYDRFRMRMMIPIHDERGRVIGFGARALKKDDTVKYINSPQGELFNKSSVLFGLHRAKSSIRDTGTAVIVEGYLDAIQAHQAGYYNVVAQMGTALTETQLQILVPRYAKKIVMALDSDAAGQNATRRSLEVARRALEADYAGRLEVDIRILSMPDAKDPDDLIRETPEQWAELVDGAQPVADFVIDLETATLPERATIQERKAVAERVLPVLTASEDKLYKQDNLQKLALRLRLPESDLLQWAQGIQVAQQQQKQRQQKARQAREIREREQAQQAPPPAPATTVDTPPDMPDFPPFIPDDAYASMPPPDDDDFLPMPNMNLPDLPPNPVQQRQQTSAKRSASSSPMKQSQQENRAIEAHCLRLLLNDPNLLFRINRQLRELAGQDDMLTQGPLQDFSGDDFKQSDYRLLLESLMQAVRQPEMSVMEFLEYHLDAPLQEALEVLLCEEPVAVHQHMAERFKGDFERDWDIFRRSQTLDTERDFIDRALEVRRRRLKQEQQEIYFLVQEAQLQNETEQSTRLMKQYLPVMRAGQRLHVALKPESLS